MSSLRPLHPCPANLLAPGDDHGMSTAEYALGTVSACAFAAVLYLILTGSGVQDVLTSLVTDALQIGG